MSRIGEVHYQDGDGHCGDHHVLSMRFDVEQHWPSGRWLSISRVRERRSQAVRMDWEGRPGAIWSALEMTAGPL